MKLSIFKYTDSKGKISSRKVLVTKEPFQYLAGLDVTELDDESIAEFAAAYDDLLDEFQESIEQLKAVYDLKHSYRQFVPIRVEDALVEHI